MAMSKRCFVFLLLLVVVALGGGVAIVVWIMNKNAPTDSVEDYELVPTDYDSGSSPTVSLGAKPMSAAECYEWSNSKSTQVEFTAKLGHSKLAVRETVGARSGLRILRNAHWLTGDSAKDAAALKLIEVSACQGDVPVAVIKMRPSEGLRLHHGMQDWNFYKPQSSVLTWKDYDKKLEPILRRLASIPTLMILEPDLLMYSFDTENQQYRWMNSKYEDEFLNRAQRIIRRLRKSWVYVDAGNAAYLSKLANVEQMALTLSRLTGLRGFAINSMHFVNRTYNEAMARRLHCRTGLHYVVDTSRNGGQFSMQSLSNIEECLFDPPQIKPGQKPSWSWGSKYSVKQERRKRWIHQYSDNSANELYQQQNQRTQSPLPPPTNPPPIRQNYQATQSSRRPQNSHRIYSTDRPKPAQQPTLQLRSGGEASQIVRSHRSKLRACVTKSTFMSAHDASVWLKSPYESDGRLYAYGSVHSCLVGHTIQCDDSCQMITHSAVNQRSPDCRCENSRRNTVTNTSPENFIFSGFPFGSER